eukprot:m.80887 g.80887  ORF g.80887 m.80887 type:complete len:438 (+) comp12618_c0_seq2:7538-8851(+)
MRILLAVHSQPTTMAEPYPPIAPYQSDFLQVSDIHRIYYEQSGNPNGYPVIFLHGGPGGGTSGGDRTFFDPKFYRIILTDQRGAGKSTPHACLEENTTWHLVADIEKLRVHLDIEKWVVFGGSWGSTLSLTYAETHPTRVTSLVLRGIFTLRREELLWFYQEGASFIMPDYWEEYLEQIPTEERGDMISAYYKRLTGSDRQQQLSCASAWSKWECATCKLYVDEESVAKAADPHWALAFARIECHYFVNGGFFEYDGQVIAELHKIKHIPTTVVQGRYDLVCPMKTCWDLHKSFPEAEIIIVDDNGHSSREPGIQRELVAACDRVRDMLKTGSVSADTISSLTAEMSLQAPAQASAYAPAQTPVQAQASAQVGRQATPQRAAGVSMQQMDYPGARFHAPPKQAAPTGQPPSTPNLDNAMHKRQLQPPGGFSHGFLFG